MEQKKKILIFIDWFLPGFKAGGPVRSMANIVDHLSEFYDFYIVTRNTEYQDIVPYSDIVSDQWTDFKPGVKVWYASKSVEGLGQWQKIIHSIDFDTVYINGIYSLTYSIMPLIAAKRCKFPNVIISPRGMLAPSALEIKSHKKNLFLMAIRFFRFYAGVKWHATNDKEASEVLTLCGQNAVVYIASNLPKKTSDKFNSIQKQKNRLSLCAFTRVSPEKNTLYAIQCLGALNDEMEVSFDIYGEIYNQDYWDECQNAIKLLPAHIKVTHKGVVEAEQVGLMMTQYHGMLLPTRGENFGHAILECLMAGRPVVISDQTPWRHLTEKLAGWDIALDEMSAFTSVIGLLAKMQQDEFDGVCHGAFQLASAYVNDKSLLLKYSQMFDRSF